MRKDGRSLKAVTHLNIGTGSGLSFRSKPLGLQGFNKRVRNLQEVNNRVRTGTIDGTQRFWSDLGMKA